MLGHSGEEKGGSLVTGWYLSVALRGRLQERETCGTSRSFTETEGRDYGKVRLGRLLFLTPPIPVNLYPLSSKRKTEFLKSPKSPFSYRTFREIVVVVDLVLFKMFGFLVVSDVANSGGSVALLACFTFGFFPW